MGQLEKQLFVGGRDSPHEVFDPWVRWDLGLDRIRSFRVIVIVVVLTALSQFGGKKRIDMTRKAWFRSKSHLGMTKRIGMTRKKYVQSKVIVGGKNVLVLHTNTYVL